MKVLFIHQNFPAQYRHIALLRAREGGHELVAIAKSTAGRVRGVRHVLYKLRGGPPPNLHPYVADFEGKMRHAHAVLSVATAVKEKGFEPDIVLSYRAGVRIS